MTSYSKTQAGNQYNFRIVFIAAIGSFTYGYNNAIIGSVFGQPGFFEVRQLPLRVLDSH